MSNIGVEKWENEVEHLTIDHQCIWPIVQQLPPYVEGEAVPILEIEGLPAGVQGTWSLHKLTAGGKVERFFALFTHDDGRILHPTATMVWDALLFGRFTLKDVLAGEKVHELFKDQRKNAVAQSEKVFHSLLSKSTDKSGSMIPDFHTYLLARVE